MNGFSSDLDTRIPTDRWKVRELSLICTDFAAEATAAFEPIATDAAVAFEIGVDEHADFVAALTGIPNPDVIAQFSRMKHGDLDAVSLFARTMAATAMQSERFVSLMREAVSNERVVYLTTVAVFNAPSASNLLLKTTAGHLNILLARKGLPPVIVAELTRLSDHALGYASKTVRERRLEFSTGRGVTLIPENFRDQSVIFLDDLFSTGFTIYRAERRLRRANVADRFYLLAARMDPRAVGGSNGQIEDRLNDICVGGSLESLGPMLKRGNFAVVQKLVKIVLAPKYTERLPEFLREIPTPSILKIFATAASDGYWHKREQFYRPSMLILKHELHQRGALDAEGHMLDAPVDLAALA